MPEEDENPKNLGTNPLIAIGIAIFIAFIMVTATTVIFLHSDAYTTVKQIKIGNEAVKSLDKTLLDTDSPINAQDIDNYSLSIYQRLKAIDDYTDFGPEAVSDSALGL